MTYDELQTIYKVVKQLTPKRMQLIRLIEQQPGITAEEISSELGWKPNNRRQIIFQLSQIGVVKKSGSGYYVEPAESMLRGRN